MVIFLHQTIADNKCKFLFVLLFLFSIVNLKAQTVVIQEYNGDEYLVKEYPDICSIINKKYSTFDSNSTEEVEFPGETYDDMLKRGYHVDALIYQTARLVLVAKDIPLGNLEWSNLLLTCYFDSQSKEFVGVKFIFDKEMKNYITLEKVNLLEQALFEANINKGSVNLFDNSKKYFSIIVKIDLGT